MNYYKIFLVIIVILSIQTPYIKSSNLDVTCYLSSTSVLNNGNYYSFTSISCSDGYWAFYLRWEIDGAFGDCFVSSNILDCPLMINIPRGIDLIRNEMNNTRNLRIPFEKRKERIKSKMDQAMGILKWKGAKIVEKLNRDAGKDEMENLRKVNKKEFVEKYVF